MAERRMISLKVIDTDKFLEMPLSTRYLYHELNVRADDDGFVGSPKKITKMVGGTDDDLKILAAKEFILPFQSGVIVIKHWRINNYVPTDRYKKTVYLEEANMLEKDKKGEYFFKDCGCQPPCIQDVDKLDTQDRLGKDRLGKDRLKSTEAAKPRFSPPPVEEVREYCKERGNGIDPQRFVDYYTANGWMAGKVKMKDWKAAVRNWEGRNGNAKPSGTITPKLGEIL